MTDDSTNVSLLVRVRDLGDERAWREFDARYRDLVLRYCRRQGLQASDSEDVRQMVMWNLAKKLRGFEYEPARGRFRSYLGTTVRNAIHRHFRSPNANVAGLESGVASELEARPDATLDDQWEEEWRSAHYRRALQHVREAAEPKSVDVFEALLAGATLDAVAARFGMRRDAVQKVKQRLRDRLRDRIARQVDEEDGLT